MMATMISEIYDALKEVGASDEKARSAAEAVAEYQDRFTRFEVRQEKLEGRMNLLQWMVGTNVILTIGILWKLFTLKP